MNTLPISGFGHSVPSFGTAFLAYTPSYSSSKDWLYSAHLPLPLLFLVTPEVFFIRCLPLVCHSSSSCPHHLQTVYPSSFPWAQQASPRYSFLPTLQLPITAFHWAPLCLSPGAHNPRVQALGRAVGRMPIPCSRSVPLTRGREEPVDSFSAFPQPLNPKGYPKMGFLQLLQVQVAEPGICDPSLPVCSLLALVLCF